MPLFISAGCFYHATLRADASRIRGSFAICVSAMIRRVRSS